MWGKKEEERKRKKNKRRKKMYKQMSKLMHLNTTHILSNAKLGLTQGLPAAARLTMPYAVARPGTCRAGAYGSS